MYPEVWANNTNMTDMSLPSSKTSDGRTYKWYNGKAPAPFLFGEGMTYSSFSTTVASSASDDTAGTDYTVTVKNSR